MVMEKRIFVARLFLYQSVSKLVGGFFQNRVENCEAHRRTSLKKKESIMSGTLIINNVNVVSEQSMRKFSENRGLQTD